MSSGCHVGQHGYRIFPASEQGSIGQCCFRESNCCKVLLHQLNLSLILLLLSTDHSTLKCTLLEEPSQHPSAKKSEAVWGRTRRSCLSNKRRALKLDPDFKFKDHIHRGESAFGVYGQPCSLGLYDSSWQLLISVRGKKKSNQAEFYFLSEIK